LQVCWVHKHCFKPTLVGPIPCATIHNNIIWSKVGACHENNNLVLAHIPAQCPLAFSERGMKIVNDTKMVLVLFHPCINIIITCQVGWITFMCGIKNAFSTCTFVATSHDTTLSFMNPYLFISAWCI
jgi:hypothetical protein